ncbi:MAG: hypothetical protein F6K58_11075 [Symploca sp. SIO2E9]|nr:hypothetical protein [Symploca sp. SIO2E9]
MQKIKLIRQVIASTILLLTLAPQGRQIAQEAPASSFLLDVSCVNAGMGNWTSQTQDISIDRAVYTSKMFMGPGDSSASMTCRIQPNKESLIFQTLKLEFGMRDNDQGSPPVRVNLYLDGFEVESRTVSAGKKDSILVDVTNTSNVALEAVCSGQNQYCRRVYFWEASLEGVPAPE